MTQMSQTKQGIRSIFWKRGSKTALYYIGLTLLGALIIAASAQVELPLLPVPVTLQTFAVVLLAMGMGWRLGVAACMSYLVAGTLGAPVFAGLAAGPAVLIGPTGGYLVAFPLAAFLTGYLTQHFTAKKFLRALLVAVVGLAFILMVGGLYLSNFIGVNQAFIVGVQPFLLAAVCKAIMIAVVVPRVWRFGK